MHWQLAVLLTAIGALAVLNVGQTGKQKQPPAAGWPGIFPDLPGYVRSFEAPIIEDNQSRSHYRQTADYEWSGGADRHIKVTFARNTEFKKTYSAEEVNRIKPAPERLEVAKHPAWLWKFEREGSKEIRPLHTRLVVLLGEDRAVIIELSGLGPFADDAQALAAKMDLRTIKTALNSPPKE